MGYVLQVNRNALSRLTALLTAALVGISTAGIAVAHGHAHLEMQAHASADGAEAHAPDGDHGHPEVTLGASARTDATFVLAVPPRPAVPFATVTQSESAQPGSTRLVPSGSPRASPRQPRAPPLV